LTEILAEENEAETYKKMVQLFGTLEPLNQFIRGRERDGFVMRSLVNLICALLWHIAFVHHLTHPRVSIAEWHAEDLHLRAILLPHSVQTIATELRERLTECHRYLRQQVGRLKDRAEQQVRARNSQEALQERGVWVTIEWMSAMARALDEEGWARMRRLETVLRGGLPMRDFIGTHGQRRTQFDWLRDWVIFSLFIDIPPMRPQNGELEVMDQLEPAGSRRTNGILFLKERTSIQIVQFKNAVFHGEHIIDLPDQLATKIIAYMNIVRPVYAISPMSADEELERENDSDDEESNSDNDGDPEAEAETTRETNNRMRNQPTQMLFQSMFLFY
jgi:hypothetical protein